MPYYEEDSAYKKADFTQWAWYNPSINQNGAGGPRDQALIASGIRYLNSYPNQLLKCPSDERSQLLLNDFDWNGNPTKIALTAYYGVNGIDQLSNDGVLYVNSQIALPHIYDGTSNTLMVGERPPSYTSYYGWWYAGSGDWPYHGATDVMLGVHEIGGGTPPVFKPEFYRPGALNDPRDEHRWHYWSLHPDGGNWLLADGHVRFIRYSAGRPITNAPGGAPTVNRLPPATYYNAVRNQSIMAQLATRRGGEAISTSAIE